MALNVLLDTQIGDNVDDAFALALACCSEEIKLVGVTTTYYGAAHRALLARQLLGAYGKLDVPVAAGEERLYRSPNRGIVYPVADIGPETPLAPPAEHGAVDFIAQKAAEFPGLTVVCTGPLTNVGSALQKYPSIEGSIGRIVFMGGWTDQAMPEFNLGQDPDAVARVFRSSIPLLAIDFETTLTCVVREPHRVQLELSSGEGPRLLRQFYKAWLHRSRRPVVLHDPLTVAALCEPAMLRIVRKRLSLRETGPGAGGVYADAEGGRWVEVATEVDAARFIPWLMDRVAPPSSTGSLLNVTYGSRFELRTHGAYRLAHYAGWAIKSGSREHETVATVESGKCRLALDARCAELEEGAVFYIPRNRTFSIESPSGMKALWLHFDAEFYEGAGRVTHLSEMPGVRSGRMPPQAEVTLRPLLAKAVQHCGLPHMEGVLLGEAAAHEIVSVILVASREPEPEPPNRAAASLQAAKRYIESHVTLPLTLDDLSRHVFLSKYHLARLFKQAYGMSPIEYHNVLRLQRAESLLRIHRFTVNEVARSLGYESVQGFCRAFRKAYGISPGQYRARFAAEG